MRVKDLNKSLAFYQKIMGLKIERRGRDPMEDLEIVELGFEETLIDALHPLLILKHDPSTKETAHNFAGLFHFAILVPDRKSLAHAYSALERNHLRFEGFADHLVSESLYLHDPERNGIEIYRDRPISEWTRDRDGHIVMDTLPLDLDGVLNELSSEERNSPKTFPNGAKIGHMHLRVTNLEQSVRFYREKLGLHVSADWSRMGAMFLAAGNYHHHIGLNVWYSLNGKKHERGDAGLDKFMIRLPRDSGVASLGSESVKSPSKRNENEELLSDPDGIQLSVGTA
jgi:catechol 2,3-dioxygenase